MAVSKTQHVVVVGAAGAIGRLVAVDLLRKGHEVSAVVRSPGKFQDLDVTRELTTDQAQRLRIVQADARDAATLTTVITPKSIVVTAFGVSKRRSNGLFAEAAVAIVDAMRCCGAERVIAITSSGVRADDHELAAWYRLLVRPLLRDVYEDMARMEQIFTNAELEWCFVRPVFLTDREGEDPPRIEDAQTPAGGRTVSRGAVARFIVGEIESRRWTRKAPTLAV